jgi:hypothetical protein
MSAKGIFFNQGALLLKDVVNIELAKFLTLTMMRAPMYGQAHEDPQVPNTIGRLDHEYVLETLHEKIWPYLENVIETELLPTYSYGRVYTNGNVLEKHRDRPSCEISLTVQLGRTHHYAWPIFMGDKRYDLAEGDGVLYLGCDIEHWRDKCDGPIDYASGQVFFHFVKANGQHQEFAGDKRWANNNAYDKTRHLILEQK